MTAPEVVTIDTPSLGDRSYLVTDGTVAVVVDPQRDTDRVTALLRARGLRLSHVLETHVHNDYVTGGWALAREEGARYCLNADDPVAFERTGVRDGDVLETGDLVVRVIATPGHTYTHLSYAVSSRAPGAAADDATVVFTGGSLLHGSTGRPDLLGPDHTRALARHQHASARRLVDELPEQTPIYPTHGFGSFCAATPTSSDAGTIGSQRSGNPALTLPEQEWVEQTLAALTAYPAYYVHMAPANSAGPAPVDLSAPAPADATELRRRVQAGEWVVDLRSRAAYAAGHVEGTLGFDASGSFITYLGWLIPWGTPVTLLGESAEQVDQAQRDLARIGIDRPAAVATGSPEEWSAGAPLRRFRRVGFDELAGARAQGDDPFVLDLRRDDEREGLRVTGTAHVPLHELAGRLGELPAGRPLWVHCASGYRASIGASLLERAGHEVVLVDDEVDRAEAAGLLVERGGRVAAR